MEFYNKLFIAFGIWMFIVVLTVSFAWFDNNSRLTNVCLENGFEKFSRGGDSIFCVGNGKDAMLVVSDIYGNKSLIAIPVKQVVE